jgi:citrate lyase beta subunit
LSTARPGADAIILDLEDAVAASEKDRAQMLAQIISRVGAVTVDGRMIDVPIVDRAKTLLERGAAIAAREAKKSQAAATA